MVLNNSYPPLDDLDLDIKANLLKYTTIRVDIKNFGIGNDIKLLDGFEDICYKENPLWFCDERGRGLLIQSFKGSLNFNLKSIKKGTLKIALRGMYFPDKNGERVPVYINISNFLVNNEKICENKLVWHDEPYVFEKEVEDSELTKIELEWGPMNKGVFFNNALKWNFQSLKKDNRVLLENNNRLKQENLNLKNELNDYKEKNFNLMVTLEKIAKENYNLKNELKTLESSKNRLSFFNKK